MTAISHVIGRKKVITATDDADFLLLADTGGEDAGVWVFHFVPDPDDPFDGTLVIEGRIQGQQAYEDAVAFAPIPYRPAILNGVASDYTLTTAAITGESLITVPATAIAVSVLVSCASGKGTLYSYPRRGDAGLP
jgi:hypothetical protein